MARTHEIITECLCLITTTILGRREIRELPVKCDSMERDCQWVGTVGALEEHVGVCQFTLVPCPKECKDDNGILKIMRRDLPQHLITKCSNRDYSCEHCGLKGTYATTLDHYDTCENKMITCTNEGCTIKMKRMNVKNHISKKCGHTVISCKYMSIGCDVKLKRKDMRAHEQDDKAHLNKALDGMIKLEDTVIELEEKVAQLQNVKKILGKGEPMIFKVTEFQKKKDNNVRFYSPSFYTSPNGYHTKIGVDANGVTDGKGSHVSVYAHVIKGKYDDELNWPFIGKVDIELLNQLEDKNHHSDTISFMPEYNTNIARGYGRGYSEYISHSELSRDSASNTQYLKDDTLYFRISVEISDHKPWLECTV